ncbi:MAG: hypothetical protein TH68_04260, partial [Candidatus Synechococcus spongiarum 142]
MPVIPQSVEFIDVDLLRCYALELSPSAVTTVEGSPSTYTVKLSNQPSTAVTVTVSGMGNDVMVDTDSGTRGENHMLSFSTSNWNTARPVTVVPVEDDNTDSEAVTLRHTTTSGDSTYPVSKSLRVTVIDNDALGLALSPAAALTVVEAGSATYTVRLATEPTADVTVTVSGMGSGVSVDTDGGIPSGQTSFSFTTSNWQTEQTVTVSAAADENASPETVTLSHTATGGNYGSVTAELVVTATDDDDDTTAGLVFSPELVTVAETGSATYTVWLATEPTADVTVTVSGMGSNVSVNTDGGMPGGQTTLSFAAPDWNTAQTVTVSAAADENISPETVTLSHTAAGGDYASVSQDLAVTVTDDDTPGLVFSAEAVTVVEAASVTYTVQLAHQPSAAVTVTVTVRGMDSGVSVDTDSG